MQYHRLCRSSEIAAGQAKMFQIGDITIGLFQVGNQYHAMENSCPHAGASLAHGYLEGDEVSCRIHHWRFRVSDGKYLDADNESCDRLTFPTRVADGWVEIGLA